MPEPQWPFLSLFSQTFDKFVNNPITNWAHFFNPQMIFNFNPQDAPVEAHVLSKVGSYGSQISTLIDMIAVLRERLPETGLSGKDEKSIAEFDKLCDAAQQAVDEFRGQMGADDIVTAAKAFAKRAPDAADRLRKRLDDALDKKD